MSLLALVPVEVRLALAEEVELPVVVAEEAGPQPVLVAAVEALQVVPWVAAQEVLQAAQQVVVAVSQEVPQVELQEVLRVGVVALQVALLLAARQVSLPTPALDSPVSLVEVARLHLHLLLQHHPDQVAQIPAALAVDPPSSKQASVPVSNPTVTTSPLALVVVAPPPAVAAGVVVAAAEGVAAVEVVAEEVVVEHHSLLVAVVVAPPVEAAVHSQTPTQPGLPILPQAPH